MANPISPVPGVQLCLVGLLLACAAEGRQAAAVEGQWRVQASVAAKAGYDTNVFLQDRGDQAGRESWFTAFTPAVAATLDPGPALKVALSYAPEIVHYHRESSENHVAHRAAVNLSGKSADTAWAALNSVLWIDGSRIGPRFTGGGDIPAIGGVPLRDRRAAAVLRNSLKVTRTMGRAFLRPMLSSYLHDFRTELHVAGDPGFEGYENYLDRREFSAGMDAGYAVTEEVRLVLGYRYGEQKQRRNQFGATSPYSNRYHRLLAGVEGSPAPWIKLAVVAGPDIRDYRRPTPPGFDRSEIFIHLDASATLMPSPEDTVTLAARRGAQPAFSSHSLYQDIVYDVTWRRRLDEHWSAAASLMLYIADWQAPVAREDWVLTPALRLAWAPSDRLSAELAWSWDRADSKVPGTAGREFKRHILSAGLRHVF